MQKGQQNSADRKSVIKYIQWQFFIKSSLAATNQAAQDSKMGDEIVLSITIVAAVEKEGAPTHNSHVKM